MDDDIVDIRHWSIEFHGRHSLEHASSSSCQPCKANISWRVPHGSWIMLAMTSPTKQI